MTDKAIIKALEYCSTGEPCFFCFYQKQCEETDLSYHALDLINRQQAEIERLNKEVGRLSQNVFSSIQYEDMLHHNEKLFREMVGEQG